MAAPFFAAGRSRQPFTPTLSLAAVEAVACDNVYIQFDYYHAQNVDG